MIRRDHRLIRLTLTWAITTALVMIAGSPAHACVCDLALDRRVIDESDGAFVGTVEDLADEHGATIAIFRVESVVKGRFGPRANVRMDRGTSCALNLEVGQRTGLFPYRDQDEGWEANQCSQVPANLLLANARSISTPIPGVSGGPPGASFPWSAIGLVVGIVIAGSMIVFVRRRRPVH